MQAEDAPKMNDLISILYREGHRFKGSEEESKDSGTISDDVIRETIHEILVGSVDTSWNTLGAMVWYLSHNPAVQDKLRAELQEFLRKNPRPNVKDITNTLPYFEAVISETFRLAAPINLIPKATSRDTTLGGYPVSKGTAVFIHAEAMSTNPESFNDSDKFIPERWLGDRAAAEAKLVIPFGVGKRSCPGQGMGYLQVRALTMLLFGNFKMKPAPGSETFKAKYEIGRLVHEDSTKVFIELAN
eukprot:TRINITY_DN23298_c0_g1_i2.p1 TRINITY_DN23298_c0_g1~~TRINITY_DN23298_c0_g1_i2.p1  ORF type:complete len:244 (-),score=69.59 TRINITY_DN23298_c0_g1_i2:10-741(-)